MQFSIRRFVPAVTVVLALVAVTLMATLSPSPVDALTLGTTQKFFVNGFAHDGSVNGVHCSPAVGAVPAGCVSVGTNEGNQKPLVIVGEGANQTASYADADGGRHWLADVWCSTSQRCIAVGYADTTTGNHPYIMDFANGTWTRVANIDPPDYSSTSGTTRLNMISCTDIDNCVAVGYSQSPSTASPANVVRPIAFSKIAGTWSNQYVVPNAAVPDLYTNPPTARLTTVDCVSASKCYAAGTYGLGSGTTIKPFVATGTVSGGAITWVTTEIGLANFTSYSYGSTPQLSCSSVNYCVATGSFTDSSAVSMKFFLEMTNGAWAQNAVVADINPSNRPSINAIDCPADGQCYIATGTAQGTSGGIITLTNGTPSFQLLTKSSAQAGWLNTITCPSAQNCVVGGSFQDSGAQFNIALGSLENGVWSINATYPTLNDPNSTPAWVQWDSNFNSTTSLSCRADGQCLAGSSNRANNAWRATLTNFTYTPDSPPSSSSSSSSSSTTQVSSTTSAPGGSSTTVGAGSVTADQLRSLPEGRIVTGPVRRGGTFTARWGGFPPGMLFRLWMASTPVELGSAIVDADGYVTIEATIPSDVASGTHTLALMSDDGTLGVQFQYTFDAQGNALPYTGSDSRELVLYAGLLLGAGVVLAFIARRRLSIR